jgi:hypothetical protein
MTRPEGAGRSQKGSCTSASKEGEKVRVFPQISYKYDGSGLGVVVLERRPVPHPAVTNRDKSPDGLSELVSQRRTFVGCVENGEG